MARALLKISAEIIISQSYEDSLPPWWAAPRRLIQLCRECLPSHANNRAEPETRLFCEQSTGNRRQGEAGSDNLQREGLRGERCPPPAPRRSWVAIWEAAFFLVLMGAMAGCLPYGGRHESPPVSAPAPAPPPPPPAPPTPVPGRPPVSTPGQPPELFWNAWAEDSAEPRFTPITTLRPNTKYRLALDLAAFKYGQSAGVGGPFRQEVPQWLKPGMPPPSLQVLLLPAPGSFREDPVVADFPIDLDRLRKIWQRGIAPHDDYFRVLRDFNILNRVPDFKVNGIFFEVETTDREGLAEVAFSIWDKDRPLDEAFAFFCVATSPDVERTKCGPDKLPRSHEGLLSVRGSSVGGKAPAAALHFVAFGQARRVFGIFHSNVGSKETFWWWRHPQEAAAFRETLSHLLQNIAFAKTDQNLLIRGEALFSHLFPDLKLVDGTGIREKVLTSLRPFMNEPKEGPQQKKQEGPSDDDRPPSIFVRMLQVSPSRSLPIPLGLLAVRVDEKKEMTRENGRFLGEHFLIESPLEIQSYDQPTECLSRWVMVLPPEIPKDTDISAARKQWGSMVSEWAATNALPFGAMDKFMEWLRRPGKTPAGDPPTALVTLSHHNANSLYFYPPTVLVDNPLEFGGINRKFLEPSVAILNGCGTGGAGAVDLIRRFNEKGFSAVIAASTELDGLMAGTFLRMFADEISKSSATKGRTIGSAYWKTIRRLSKEKLSDPAMPEPFGARALMFTLLGNSSVLVCPPDREKRPSPTE
jgi:hypothetical protein